MRYLSWDIGIKNLSYCLTEYINSEISVIDWDIIDISGETIMNQKCQGIKKKGGICGKTANYYVKEVDKYFCKEKECNTNDDEIDYEQEKITNINSIYRNIKDYEEDNYLYFKFLLLKKFGGSLIQFVRD